MEYPISCLLAEYIIYLLETKIFSTFKLNPTLSSDIDAQILLGSTVV